jgi:hypothetical protein
VSTLQKTALRIHNTLITSGLDFDDRIRALKSVTQLQECQRNEAEQMSLFRNSQSTRLS